MLEGEINEINLVERLVELWRERFTGAIRFENEGIIKILYFKNGDVLSASTNDRSDSIDEILMRAGKVSREHVKQALARRKESETLGDALLNLGFITRKELTWARRVQVVGVIRSIAAWTEGSFTIVADYLPKRDEGTLFPLPQVIIELAVTEQDRARFERELDGGNAVFSKTMYFDDLWRHLGLNEDADAIAAEIDGEKTANEIATASGGETFNVYKLLWGLSILGVLTRGEKPQVSPEFMLDDFASAGVADAADMWSEPVVSPPAPPHFDSPDFELDTAIESVDIGQGQGFDFDAAPAEPEFEITPEFQPEEPAAAAPIPEEPPAEPLAPREKLSWAEPVTPPEAVFEPQQTSRMPAWDAPPRQPAAVPIPGSFEPPVEAEEELGGFDEAQLETARKASAPTPAAAAARAPRAGMKQQRPRSRRGLLIALLAIVIVAAGAYFGLRWWQAQQEISIQPQVARTAPKPVTTSTVAPVASSTEVGGPETSTALTTSPVAVPDATIVETAPVPPATPTTAAPAASVATAAASDPLRARLDAMARENAASPRGNYTVQIQILCSPANLESAMRAGGEAVWFVPQPMGDRSCYRVFWGRFETRDQAQKALGQIPARLRDRSAAVKPVPRG